MKEKDEMGEEKKKILLSRRGSNPDPERDKLVY